MCFNLWDGFAYPFWIPEVSVKWQQPFFNSWREIFGSVLLLHNTEPDSLLSTFY